MTRIMIVDDDRTTVMLLKTLLELDGYEVVVASRGMDVIPTAEKHPPDIIMMDYNLADTDGVAVLNDLRKHAQFARLPVIIASGLNVRDEVLAAGADAFLVKPFEPSELTGLFSRLTGA